MHRFAIDLPDTLLERYAAALIALGGLTLILAATLHPFNFAPVQDFTWQLVLNRLDLRLMREDSWVDIPRNILLFVPYGFGMTALLHTLRLRAPSRLLLVGVIGLGTTVLVECLQFLLQLRSPELSDVLANTCGALMGYVGYQRWLASDLHSRHFMRYSAHTRALITTLPLLTVLTMLPFGLILEAQSQSLLTDWDSGYYLAIGNEITGDRPWRGEIDELLVLDRAASSAEVATYLGSTQMPVHTPPNAVAHYCLACDQGLRDLVGISPTLVRHSARVVDNSTFEGVQPTTVGATQGETVWFESDAPATNLSRRIAETSEFSVLASIHPAGEAQSGPARIFTLSKDAYNRNFTLGQEGDALVVRLRTLGTGNNGLRPEFTIPSILRDDTAHRVVVTYAAPRLTIYVDYVANSFSARLAPEIATVSNLIPLSSWHVAMNVESLSVYTVIYYLLFIEALLPLGLVVLAWMTRSSRDRHTVPTDAV